MAYKKKDKKTPTDLNGMLTTVTIVGRWPDFEKEGLNRCALSNKLSYYLDRVDVEVQNILYRLMRKVTKDGMIIICEHSTKPKSIVFKCELYLGRPSPVISQVFKEQVNNIDINTVIAKIEEKIKNKNNEEDGEFSDPYQEDGWDY